MLTSPPDDPNPKPAKSVARKLLARAVKPVAAIAIIVGGIHLQTLLLYHPERGDRHRLEEEAKARRFAPWNAPDGRTIGYRSTPKARDAHEPLNVLVIHGNAGYALHRTEYADVLRHAAPELDISLYILEYPGYGARGGRMSQRDFLWAAEEALSLIPDDAPLIILGESIGTGVVAGVVSKHSGRAAGLLLVTPFDDLAAVAQQKFPFLPVRLIMRDQYPAAKWLESYHRPVVVVLAGEDRVIPTEFGQRLHDSYRGPKNLLVAEGAGHNDVMTTLSSQQWRDALGFLLGGDPQTLHSRQSPP